VARIRSIHPDALKSEKLARVGAEAERCYWRLTTICDDQGRAEDHPRLIWATLFPLNDDATTELVDQWLSELAEVGLVERYTSGGKRCIAVTRWSDYQHPRHPAASDIPAPEDRDNPPEAYGGRAGNETSPPIGVGVGEGVGEGGAVPAESPPAAKPPRKKRGTECPDPFVLTDEDRTWAKENTPSIDVTMTTKQFVSFWRGDGRLKVNWKQTWRNWLLKNEERSTPSANGNARQPARTFL